MIILDTNVISELTRPVPDPGAQIAAICRVLSATLATRNTSDFTGIGVNLIDPWNAAGSAPPGGQHPD